MTAFTKTLIIALAAALEAKTAHASDVERYGLALSDGKHEVVELIYRPAGSPHAKPDEIVISSLVPNKDVALGNVYMENSVLAWGTVLPSTYWHELQGRVTDLLRQKYAPQPPQGGSEPEPSTETKIKAVLMQISGPTAGAVVAYFTGNMWLAAGAMVVAPAITEGTINATISVGAGAVTLVKSPTLPHAVDMLARATAAPLQVLPPVITEHLPPPIKDPVKTVKDTIEHPYKLWPGHW